MASIEPCHHQQDSERIQQETNIKADRSESRFQQEQQQPYGKSNNSPQGRSKHRRKQQTKFKKAPQAPRRFKSAYMFFSTEKHKEIRADLNRKGVIESTTNIAKRVSRLWKELPANEHQRYHEMARQDKARYEAEKSLYTGPWKVPAKTRHGNRDSDAPKRPRSAFLSYAHSNREKVKQENPSLNSIEITRLLAQQWKEAPEEERDFHVQTELALRQKYLQEVEEWRNKVDSEMAEARRQQEAVAMKADDSGVNLANLQVLSSLVSMEEGKQKGFMKQPTTLLDGNQHKPAVKQERISPPSQPPILCLPPHTSNSSLRASSCSSTTQQSPTPYHQYHDEALEAPYQLLSSSYPLNLVHQQRNPQSSETTRKLSDSSCQQQSYPWNLVHQWYPHSTQTTESQMISLDGCQLPYWYSGNHAQKQWCLHGTERAATETRYESTPLESMDPLRATRPMFSPINKGVLTPSWPTSGVEKRHFHTKTDTTTCHTLVQKPSPLVANASFEHQDSGDDWRCDFEPSDRFTIDEEFESHPIGSSSGYFGEWRDDDDL